MKVVVLLLVASVAAASPHHGVTTIKVDYHHMSFQDTEWHALITWTGKAYTAGNVVIDPKLIDGLYTAIGNTHPDTEARECNSHTDDYPTFVISIEGEEPVTIASSSNCHAHVPWNITRNGAIAVQYTGEAWPAVNRLFHAIDAKEWPIAPPTKPYLGEAVSFGTVIPSAQALTGIAGQCASSFQANPQVKELFGPIRSIDHVTASCVMSESADCSSLYAVVTFDWGNVQSDLSFPCVGGTVTVPPAIVKSTHTVRVWLGSKIMRTLLGSTTGNQLGDGDKWSLRGNDFLVFWTPGTETIELWSQNTPAGRSVWTRAGIDPKPHTTKDEGGVEVIDAVLDFNGKPVTR